MEERPYIHRVQYYETDQMGITHHSNYIRWMEEARVDFLKRLGYPLTNLEELGLLSPVLDVECSYKKVTHFDDEVEINVCLTDFGPVRFSLSYEMRSAKTGEMVCTGSSRHCILDKDYKPVRLKRDYSEFYETMRGLVRKS